MPANFKKYSICIVWPVEEFNNKNWTREQVTKWISVAGGKLQPKIDETTTHVVCSSKAWKAQGPVIQKATEAKGEGRVLKIVSPDWLADSLDAQKRMKEGPYSWEKLDRNSMGKNKAAKAGRRGVEDGDKDDDEIQANSTMGTLAEVFTAHTEKFVDKKTKQRFERQMMQEEKVRKELEAEDAREKEAKRRAEVQARQEQVALMRRGAKKAKNEIFSENHHIYTDTTGFNYEVPLTKVDTRKNRNERYVITMQIYESNAAPHTYATNLHFTGTEKRPSNSILATIGTPFATAMRVFKKSFRELTRVEWDQRIEVHNNRIKRRQEGVAEAEIEFDAAPFQYQPPAHGPRGEPAMRKDIGVAAQRAELMAAPGNFVMSGANGAGPETMGPAHIDLTEDADDQPKSAEDIFNFDPNFVDPNFDPNSLTGDFGAGEPNFNFDEFETGYPFSGDPAFSDPGPANQMGDPALAELANMPFVPNADFMASNFDTNNTLAFDTQIGEQTQMATELRDQLMADATLRNELMAHANPEVEQAGAAQDAFMAMGDDNQTTQSTIPDSQLLGTPQATQEIVFDLSSSILGKRANSEDDEVEAEVEVANKRQRTETAEPEEPEKPQEPTATQTEAVSDSIEIAGTQDISGAEGFDGGEHFAATQDFLAAQDATAGQETIAATEMVENQDADMEHGDAALPVVIETQGTGTFLEPIATQEIAETQDANMAHGDAVPAETTEAQGADAGLERTMTTEIVGTQDADMGDGDAAPAEVPEKQDVDLVTDVEPAVVNFAAAEEQINAASADAAPTEVHEPQNVNTGVDSEVVEEQISKSGDAVPAEAPETQSVQTDAESAVNEEQQINDTGAGTGPSAEAREMQGVETDPNSAVAEEQLNNPISAVF